MKYKTKIIDPGKWISSITEIKNTDDTLLINVDFHAKYLSIFKENNRKINEFKIGFIKTEDTLYAGNYEGLGEVIIIPECEIFQYFINDYGRYSCDICLIKK